MAVNILTSSCGDSYVTTTSFCLYKNFDNQLNASQKADQT